MNDQIKDFRTKALENLLHLYLTDERANGGREVELLVSERNSCKVAFRVSPSKAEIDALIEYLNLTRKFCSDQPERITLDAVNKIFSEHGAASIEDHPELRLKSRP